MNGASLDRNARPEVTNEITIRSLHHCRSVFLTLLLAARAIKVDLIVVLMFSQLRWMRWIFSVER